MVTERLEGFKGLDTRCTLFGRAWSSQCTRLLNVAVWLAQSGGWI